MWGLWYPANGYLVLVRGAADFSSVVSVSAKIAEKLTAAQKLYNVVYGFELPHPATDLDTFFRNGGTIQLVHGDLPDATDSGTDESKAKPAKGRGNPIQRMLTMQATMVLQRKHTPRVR